MRQTATEYGCLYGGKPSVSGLLAQIADGRLAVCRPQPQTLSSRHFPLIKLKIKVPTDMRGTIAEITNTIAQFGGDIDELKTNLQEGVGIMQVLLIIPKEDNLSNLITELQNMKVEAIEKFNKSYKILQALDKSGRNSEIYNIKNLQKDDSDHNKTVKQAALKEVFQQNLIDELECTIGLKLRIDNEAGALSKISKKIAEVGLLISSVNQEYDGNTKQVLMGIYLVLQPEIFKDSQTTSDETHKEVRKIKRIVNILESLTCVHKVERMSVDNLD